VRRPIALYKLDPAFNVLLEKMNMSLRKDNPSESRISLELLLRDDLFLFGQKFETMKTAGKNRPVKPAFDHIDDFKSYLLKYSVKLLDESKKAVSFISNDNLTLSFNNSRRANSYRENLTHSNLMASKQENMHEGAIQEEEENESQKHSRKQSLAERKEMISDRKSTPLKFEAKANQDDLVPINLTPLSKSKGQATPYILS
jgi:hypothetical protein